MDGLFGLAFHTALSVCVCVHMHINRVVWHPDTKNLFLWEEAEPQRMGAATRTTQCSQGRWGPALLWWVSGSAEAPASLNSARLCHNPSVLLPCVLLCCDSKKILIRVNPHGLKSVSSPKLAAISDHILQLPTSPAWQVATGSISECVIPHIKEGDWLDYPVECQAQQQRTKGSGGHVIPLSCQPMFALHCYSPEYSLCCNIKWGRGTDFPPVSLGKVLHRRFQI